MFKSQVAPWGFKCLCSVMACLEVCVCFVFAFGVVCTCFGGVVLCGFCGFFVCFFLFFFCLFVFVFPPSLSPKQSLRTNAVFSSIFQGLCLVW